ncbi:MAG TPA: DUF2797 domain-containing protein [Candidatus Saccharimonadales bacterium]|nr:DUF2797 domain-containing protein [Candidatus Saccharimonadales bacterium]
MSGDFLFIHYGFGGKDITPSLTVLRDGSDHLEYLTPRGQTLTLTFDPSQRFCTGWHDLATGESFPCPDAATLPAEYSQCMHCQRKTGFNPAFYNASSVSEQQQARNATPHFLYLAHFAPGVVKVGISWSNRGVRRLLDQGARSMLVIKEYSSANLARQYEEKIAKLNGIAETLQAKTKYSLLSRAYDAEAGKQELLQVRQRIQDEIGVTPDNNQPEALDTYYLGSHTFSPADLIQLHDHKISGRNLGLIGSAYVAEQDATPFMLSLGAMAGYRLSITDVQEPNLHAPQQASLF